jgi:hypothetical protein
MPSPSQTITAERIREWLSARPGLPATDGYCMVRGPLHERENSRLFYAECDALSSPAAIKWCLQPRTLQPDGDSAAQQFEALRRVADAMQSDGRYTVPRPYLLDRERALLAIEWIDGVTMTASIASWRCGASVAHGLIAQAGNWLRHFHRAHPLSDGSLDVAEKLRHLSEYEGCALAQERVFAQGLAELRRSAAAAASINLKRSWIHGDFKTDNLIVSGRRIVGIDVQIRHENTVVYDLAPFINHLELAFCHPTVWRLARARTRLITAFVDAYSEGKPDRVWLPLTWTRLYMMLSAWNAAQFRGLSRLRAAILGRCYRSATARLNAQLRELC